MSTSQLQLDRPLVAPGLPLPRQRAKIALAVILTCQLMLILDGTVVNIALPKIQDTFHFSSSNLSWVLNAYTLAFGGLLLLGGRMGDLLGRRRVFIAGISLFTVASMLGGLSTSAGWLVVTRAAQGIGAAFAAPSALALLMISFPEGARRNQALAFYSAVSSAGGSIGLLLGGMLTSWVSWRWGLFINVPVGIAVVLLAPRYLDDSARQSGHLDYAGAITSTVGMTALVFGFIHAASAGWHDAVTIASILVSVLLLAAFVAIEMRVERPIMPLRLLADRNRASGFLTVLLIVATMFGMFFFLTQFLQIVMGFSPVEAGVAFLPMTLLMFTTVQIVPRLLPRFGPRPIMLFGITLVAVATFWLTHVAADTTYFPGILVPMMLLGIGVSCNFLSLSVTILSGVHPRDAGAASGMLQTMQQVGGSLGVAILITVFSGATHTVAARMLAGASPRMQAHIVFAHSLGTAFTVSLVFALAAMALELFAIKAPRPATQTLSAVMPATVGD